MVRRRLVGSTDRACMPWFADTSSLHQPRASRNKTRKHEAAVPLGDPVEEDQQDILLDDGEEGAAESDLDSDPEEGSASVSSLLLMPLS